MPWDRGYYYRSIRSADGPRREYVGKGPVAELVAKMDALERDRRETAVAIRKAEREEIEALDQPLDDLNELADLAAEAALLAAREQFLRELPTERRSWFGSSA